ncbi:DUF1700 domain-containing protein [Fructilactobacillus myrtifloralis]|uniref:DUF1700 domain-containing protein n=1 Tax=Fructilactobacillus myrtifloralis TaxID=2940301 RepID=A0ABY5BM35_9LACO|nr:DUF1700 domain-containing protein [Fructilactobacillus myrtifloralis]USS84677.1 DUF1700 domain-containing protein [Fructilactobacillus myrtifloralis]
MPTDQEQYITELKYYLKNIPTKERDEAATYYLDYLKDGQLSNYKEIVANLGTPRQLARQIAANYSISEDEKQPKKGSVNHNVKLIITILAAIASPVLLGIAGFILLMLFIVVVVVGAFLFTTLVVAGLAFWVGITTIASKGIVALNLIGASLLIFGVLIMIPPIVYFVIRFIIQIGANWTKKIYRYSQAKLTNRKDGYHG